MALRRLKDAGNHLEKLVEKGDFWRILVGEDLERERWFWGFFGERWRKWRIRE